MELRKEKNDIKVLKKYEPPRLIVYGDARNITLNVEQYGSGDNLNGNVVAYQSVNPNP